MLIQKCSICKEEFQDIYKIMYHRVRDQCHYTGKYRSAARSAYNLRCDIPKNLPLVFYKRSNFDYEFVIKELNLS